MVGNENSGRHAKDGKSKNMYEGPKTPKSTAAGIAFSRSVGFDNDDLVEENADLKQIQQELATPGPGVNTKNIQREIIAYKIIDQARINNVPKETIAAWEVQLGLKKAVNPNTLNQTVAIQKQVTPYQDQIMQMISLETDPEQKKMLTLALIPDISKNPLILAQMMKPKIDPTNQGNNMSLDLHKIILENATKMLTNTTEKKPMEEFSAMIGTMKDLGLFKNGDNSVTSLIETLKQGKDLGLVQDPTSNLDEKKLEIEEKKVDNEFKRYELEKNQQADKDQLVLETAGKGINTIVNTISAYANKGKSPMNYQNQNNNPGPQNVQANPRSDNVSCEHPNCKDKPDFLVIFDKPKTFNCPHGCGSSYQLKQESGDSELNVYTTPQTEATLQALEKGETKEIVIPPEQQQNPAGNLNHLF